MVLWEGDLRESPLVITTTPTTTNVNLEIYSQSVLEHSKSLLKNYFSSITQ